MTTEEMVVIECAAACSCTSTVPRREWVKHLISTEFSDSERWMVLVHGMHQHTLAFCSIECLIKWAERVETV